MSSSLGGMSPMDVKAYRALEVMRSCHDFDSVITEGLLALVWERYSIPHECQLCVPQLGQPPYDSFPNKFELSIDTLKVGLWFLLHPVIEAYLEWRRISLSQMVPNSDMTKVWLAEVALRPAPWGMTYERLCSFPSCFIYSDANLLFCHSTDMVNLKGLKGMPYVPINCPRGKEPIGTTRDKAATRRTLHPQSIKDLCQMWVWVRGESFSILQMADLVEGEPGAPMQTHWPTLTNSSHFLLEGVNATKFGWGVLNLILAKQLYGAPSKVLIDLAAKSLVWIRTFLRLPFFGILFPLLVADSFYFPS
ncbi:hypothetical protein B296_00029054 [Ensete ventricosum]|uniref:Uncharacterized protein n=1 Tax=Ensete ventricosum TaxID=4639 RepID=A0A426X510_ENSVE|nr:hypothetical protein B296_00029054 [Ensete ventricosum]